MDFHPFAGDYPLMPQSELAIMELSMRDGGFDARFPIVTYQGKILDGRNRYLAAEAAEVSPIFVSFTGNEEQAMNFVELANENRRHLAQEWLQKRRSERIDRATKARSRGESLRTIAEKEGVSEKTIRDDLKKAGAEGVAPDTDSGKITGKDGKSYPPEKIMPICAACARKIRVGQKLPTNCKDCKTLANRSKEPEQPTIFCERCEDLIDAGEKPITDCQSCEHARTRKKGPPQRDTDDAGVKIPRHLKRIFAARALATEASRALARASGAFKLWEVSQAGRMAKPLDPKRGFEKFSGLLRNAKFRIMDLTPSLICSECSQEGGEPDECKACRGKGWLTKEEAQKVKVPA